MKMSEIVIIAGIAENNVIGNKGELPWHISEDLKRFKQLTLNKPVIMGRVTFESILKFLGKPLPGRTNIVVTKKKDYESEGIIVAHSIGEAIEKAHQYGNEIFVIGGEKIYEQMLPLANRLEITKIWKDFEGDAHFPKIKENEWRRVLTEDKEGKDVNYSFLTYERTTPKTKRGMFIVFEGIDGSGKSTQIQKFVDYLFNKDKHNHIVLTREPYKETDVRKILYEGQDPLEKGEKLFELFVNDRKKHSDELIIPCINKGFHVITNRYKYSTIAYQAAQGLAMEELIEKQKGLPIPDITFIIDISAEEAGKRMKFEENRKTHKFEKDIWFLEKVRKNFHAVKDLLKGEKIFIVNGSKSPEEIFREIKETFERETENE